MAAPGALQPIAKHVIRDVDLGGYSAAFGFDRTRISADVLFNQAHGAPLRLGAELLGHALIGSPQD